MSFFSRYMDSAPPVVEPELPVEESFIDESFFEELEPAPGHVIREVPASAVCVEPSMAGGFIRSLPRNFRYKALGSRNPLPERLQRLPDYVLGGARLGQAELDPNVILAQFYFGLIVPILDAQCQTGGAPAAKCAEFQLRLSQVQASLQAGITQLETNNPLAIITLPKAVWDAKELYDDIKDELKPEAPPPPPPPLPLPPKPSTGLPWWAWALGGVALLGGGFAVYAITK